MTLLSAGLKYIWERRCEGRPVQSAGLRGELQARTIIMGRTTYRGVARQMREAMRSFVL